MVTVSTTTYGSMATSQTNVGEKAVATTFGKNKVVIKKASRPAWDNSPKIITKPSKPIAAPAKRTLSITDLTESVIRLSTRKDYASPQVKLAAKQKEASSSNTPRWNSSTKPVKKPVPAPQPRSAVKTAKTNLNSTAQAEDFLDKSKYIIRGGSRPGTVTTKPIPTIIITPPPSRTGSLSLLTTIEEDTSNA